MVLPVAPERFETDAAGQIIYPVDNGEPLSNDTEHLKWITFVKNGLEDWFDGREDVFVAADLLWYPVEGRPDISKAPDVMVVLDHPAGDRFSYQQWQENGRPPSVVFEFISKSNTAGEILDKLAFYSKFGCDEFFIYDYRRGTFHAYLRDAAGRLAEVADASDGTWSSPLLQVTFGLDESGRLWVRRPDGTLMESQKEIRLRAEAAAEKARRLAAKLRELGVDPDAV